MTKTVIDAYVTLGKHADHTHPFEVYLRFSDGTHSQPIQNRNLRDCLICGNSMLSALSAVGVSYETVNVMFDERFNK